MIKNKLVMRIIKAVIAVTLVFFLFIVTGIIVPYVKHKEVDRDVAHACIDKEYTGTNQYGERIKNIKTNLEALQIRLQLINSAQSEIILTTFEFGNDESGRDIVSALANAAERGVKVRLLIDSYKGGDLNSNGWLRYLSTLENAEIKLYNPLNPFMPWRSQSRMHEKYMIFDGQTYIIGGRNTNDIFLGEYDKENMNSDREILVYTENPTEGSTVCQLRSYFEDYFAHEHCETYKYSKGKSAETVRERYESLKTLYPSAFDTLDMNGITYPVGKLTLLTGETVTGKKAPNIWYQMVDIMLRGEDIVIQSPYVMLGKEMSEDLKAVAFSRSVDLMVNSPLTGANKFGNADYTNNREKVWELGMTTYEYIGESSHHAKTVLVDDRISIVGSFNFDMRSAYIDSEIMLVIDSAELNQEIRVELDQMTSWSREIRSGGYIDCGEFYVEPEEMSFGERMGRFFMRLVVRPIRFLL